MELEHMTFTDGYIGSFGKTWKTPTQADLEKAIQGALVIEHMTHDEVVAILEAGGAVKWCQSANFYYPQGRAQRSSRPQRMDLADPVKEKRK